MKRPKFISVDWDFFPYNGAHDVLDTPKGQVPGIALFDWGSSEQWPMKLQALFWHTRMEAFGRVGMRIEDVAAIDPVRGCVPIEEFREVLLSRFELRAATLFSDSHALGYEAAHLAATKNAGPVDMALFDAHHDLGHGDRVLRNAKNAVMDCGDWVYHSMVAGLIDRAEVVFPDWKGKKEAPTINRSSHLWKLRKRLEFSTWSEWRARTEGTFELACGLHFCRSSAWTPPHLDAEFLRLIEILGPEPRICMDCEDGWSKIGDSKACEVRPWRK